MIRIGIIGFGYWGPNILRNFSQQSDVAVSWVCDINPKTTTLVEKQYPGVRVTPNASDIFADSTCDAVVIVTPISTHFALAKKALESEKHVLVEKPMTQTTSESEELITIAAKRKKMLMVDHTFLYTPAVKEIKKIIASKKLGDILHIDCVRTNLGLLQKDSNVIYDLATHDLSIIDYLFNCSPSSVSASGVTLKGTSQETVAYMNASYPNGMHVHAHVSWISPVKVRKITFVGSKKMLVYDDMEPTEKIKIYDKSISLISDPHAQHQLRVGYRIGSTIAPHIDVAEGLTGMVQAFIKSIKRNRPPPSDGIQGKRIVHILESATTSIRNNGASVVL
jgi:predicted dehydrogenase